MEQNMAIYSRYYYCYYFPIPLVVLHRVEPGLGVGIASRIVFIYNLHCTLLYHESR